MLLSAVNKTDLGDQDWRYALFLCYGIDHLYLPTHCDSCNSKFSIYYALDCKKGGLITNRHNDLRFGVSDLTGKDFTPLYVHDNPLIHPGFSIREVKVHPMESPHNNSLASTENSYQKGDLLIRKLWYRAMDIIHKMCVMRTDNLSHRSKSPENFLQMAEREKKKKYLKSCIQKCRNLPPFIV